MKKYLSLFILLAACSTTNIVKPNQEIEIKEKATYEFTLDSKNISIKVSKIEDSRCPENAVCVWAGEANVTFDIIINQKLFSAQKLCLQCDQESGTPQEITLEGKTITLIAVNPYPNSDKPNNSKTAILKMN